MNNKPKLVMLEGLPASGKSTYARHLVDDLGFKRVNKDDLRAMIDNSRWSPSNEKLIKTVEAEIAEAYLLAGHNVVIDSTNFGYEEYWSNFARFNNADFEIERFNVTVTECIKRDSARGEKAVGEKVIMRMYDQYLKPKAPEYDPNLPDCYIFDIDGTLAHMKNRSPYDMSKVGEDKVDKNIARILASLSSPSDIVIFSGRDSSCRNETIDWLVENVFHSFKLYMREEGDSRKDSIVKEELYRKHIEGKYNVIAVFDDRNQVVDMWRSLGLTCCQVGYGNF